MKFNKLFFAAVSFAALAMVGCKSKNDPENSSNGSSTTPPPPAVQPTEDAPEVISLDAPAAGKTTIAIYAEVCPNGAYLVGNFNDYNVGDDQTASFEAVQGQKNWYAVTIDYRDDLQAKAIARPSDPDVEKGWSFQWGQNYDPADPGDVKEGTENTRIIGGDGEFVYENNGQPKISAVKDGGVVYIWVKNWAANPVIEAKQLETAWIKSDFNGLDWAWYEMTPKGNGVFEYEGVWGGSGCNIAETENGASQWYPTEKITFEGEPAKGDKVKVTFTSEKMAIGTLKIELVEKGETPVDPEVPTTRDQEQPITVTGIVPEGWTKCYLWAWEAGDKNVFDAWPGLELTIEDGKVSYTFDDAVQVINVIFSNGEDKQTNDIKNINKDAEIVIADNLK